jgi:hypothetical protein
MSGFAFYLFTVGATSLCLCWCWWLDLHICAFHRYFCLCDRLSLWLDGICKIPPQSPFRARLAVCLLRHTCRVLGLSLPNPKPAASLSMCTAIVPSQLHLFFPKVQGLSKFRRSCSFFVHFFAARRLPLSTLFVGVENDTFVHWHPLATPFACTSTLCGGCTSSLSTLAICASSVYILAICSLSLSIFLLLASTLSPCHCSQQRQKRALSRTGVVFITSSDPNCHRLLSDESPLFVRVPTLCGFCPLASSAHSSFILMDMTSTIP